MKKIALAVMMILLLLHLTACSHTTAPIVEDDECADSLFVFNFIIPVTPGSPCSAGKAYVQQNGQPLVLQELGNLHVVACWVVSTYEGYQQITSEVDWHIDYHPYSDGYYPMLLWSHCLWDTPISAEIQLYYWVGDDDPVHPSSWTCE